MHSKLFFAAVAAILSSTTFALPPPRLPASLTLRGDNAATTMPACNLSKVSQPASTLNPPGSLTLVLVAHGDGTQNYTCGANLTAPPTSIGAVAQLFDASCSKVNEARNPTDAFGSIAESASSIGNHFFVDATTPDFNINGLGNTATKKVQDCAAPNAAADVKWLRLEAQAQGSTSSVKMIYRLNTEGGVAPASCEGRKVGEVVTVAYQAEYWFYTYDANPNILANETRSPQLPQPKQPPLEVTTSGAMRNGVSAGLTLVMGCLYMLF